MASRIEQFERVEPKDRSAWRSWLAGHSDTSPGVWLSIAKKGGSAYSPSYDEAVEEALCFGWIDSTVRAVDENRFVQMFTPRKPRSVWSRSNKERVERLTAEGLMTPAGLAAVQTAKANGSWESLDDIERMTVPPDLAEALSADTVAKQAFENLSDSQRKMMLYWLGSAKRPETRSRRVAAILKASVDGTMPF